MKLLLRSMPALGMAGALVVAVLALSGLGLPAFARDTAAGDYAIAAATATIQPATFDVGNHCDDCVTSIALPFPYTLYDQTFNALHASSNGNLQFASSDTAFLNTSLPAALFNSAVLPYWDDLTTEAVGTGIFTFTSGSTPNRIFIIEWRTRLLSDPSPAGTTNFEVRLYEGQSKFDYIYGQLKDNGLSATVGVQRDTGSKFTQWSFNTAANVTNGTKLTFTLPPPTAVVIRVLTARPSREGVVLRWRTASDAGLLGFNVWRMRGGDESRRLNEAVIPAGGRNAGSSYRLLDRTVRAGLRYRYRLQAVSLSGATSWASVATARAR